MTPDCAWIQPGNRMLIRERFDVASPGQPRVIAGYGRSGTTWVHDVLAQANSLRAVFEPLHPNAIPGAAEFAHAFRPADKPDEALKLFLEQFFSGSYPSIWADFRVRTGWFRPSVKRFTSATELNLLLARINQARRYYFRYRKQRRYPERIVKFVRGNMLLAWMKQNLDARIVFVIRHPAAVVLSQLKSPNSWDPYYQIEKYREDAGLLEVLESRTRDLLLEPLEKAEASTLCWCIENSIALQQAENNGITVVRYEKLLDLGPPEWDRISAALDLKGKPSGDLIARPSQQAWGEQARDPNLVRRYASWMHRIDEMTASRIQSVLDATDTRSYSIHQAMPIESQ